MVDPSKHPVRSQLPQVSTLHAKITIPTGSTGPRPTAYRLQIKKKLLLANTVDVTILVVSMFISECAMTSLLLSGICGHSDLECPSRGNFTAGARASKTNNRTALHSAGGPAPCCRTPESTRACDCVVVTANVVG